MQPHWVSALAWPEEEAESLWCGEPKDMLLVGRMDGSLGLIEVLDAASMHCIELEHCYRKDGTVVFCFCFKYFFCMMTVSYTVHYIFLSD